MFEMKDVGRKIATRRKEMNMTQMELADAMGVSFQAVSNWERGNSMPDIGKLPELAERLRMSIDELLTDEAPAKLVQHIIDGDAETYIHREDVRPETVAEVAPILKPQQTEGLLEEVLSSKAYSVEFGDLVSIAPFVSETFLHEWALRIYNVDNINQLAGLAPFLSKETLDLLVDKLTQDEVTVRGLASIAPFLSEQTLNRLAERSLRSANIEELGSIAPFLSTETLDSIVRKVSRTGEVRISALQGLAPFLSEESLDWLATSAMNNATPRDIVGLAPFLSQETLQRCANQLLARYGVKGIKDIAPFL